MKKSVYYIILGLIALPAGLMLGLQIGTIDKQYQRNKENFANDVKKAVVETQQIYSLWNSHTSSAEDEASYNSIYTNADSTFSVLIAQSAQPYPLLDFAPDTILPKIRKEQFLRFQEELESTRREENKRLREFYVLRSIQYCADCEDSEMSIAQIFPLDSLIRSKLKENDINISAEIAFYNSTTQQYGYVSQGSDTINLANSSFQYQITNNEVLQLNFPRERETLRKELTSTVVSSLGLVLISLFCFGFAARMLFKQKQITEMKTNFINNVTHELKTPIATINFALANIENDNILNNPNAIKQFTEVIKYENQRLNNQVEKVLQAAALNRNTLTLKKEKVELHAILEKLVSSYQFKLGENDTLTHKLMAKHHFMKGDSFHLSNMVSNLLDNAIKYSGDGKEIKVETENEGQNLIIRFTDNGMGISKEQQKLIFEQFYRVPTGDLHNIKGFGLGLSYVKSIVKAHDGEIQVKSKLNKGSIFTIILPTAI